MGKIYAFIYGYLKDDLNARMKALRGLLRKKSAAIVQIKQKSSEDIMKLAELQYRDGEIDGIYLELLDKSLFFGEKYKFSAQAFSRVKKTIAKTVKDMRAKIHG